MKEQILAKRSIKIENILNGGTRICWGLIKKLIIAGRAAIIIETIKNAQLNGAYAFLCMILYSIQLYSDFSGGIDIVLGISKILGINLKENFDSPFLAQNIKEFWRRWHISLSSWLRDYIYIPLGGSRCSKLKKTMNVLITFIISGIWHGTTYILWGLIHGVFVLFGDKFNTKSKFFNRIVNFVIVSILWSFFIWNSNIEALKMIGSIFTNFNIIDLLKNNINFGITKIDGIILSIFTVILFIFDTYKTIIIEKIKNTSKNKKLALICTMILVILTFGIYGIGFNVNEFIYSKF